MSNYLYVLFPIFSWCVAGACKFLINSFQSKRLAFHLVGYGGLPSTHTTIVFGMTTLIALKEGFNTPIFGVSLTLAFIVIIDAISLRRLIGRQSESINLLNLNQSTPLNFSLRERVGHTPIEIISGMFVGGICGWVASMYG